MSDLKEHLGAVLGVMSLMWVILIGLAGIIWKDVKIDLGRFPLWLKDMDNKGGVVTHSELLEDGPLMTAKTHEIICARVVAQVAAQISLSERHQKDMLELIEKEFKAVFEGQKAMIQRLSDLQDNVIKTITARIGAQ